MGVEGGGSMPVQASSGLAFIAAPLSPSVGKAFPKDAETERNLCTVCVKFAFVIMTSLRQVFALNRVKVNQNRHWQINPGKIVIFKREFLAYQDEVGADNILIF